MPLTLHAAWLRSNEPYSDGKLFLWAETLDFQPSTRSTTGPAPVGLVAPTASQFVRQRQPKTPSHPGQLPVHQLRTLIAEESHRLPTHEMQPLTATVWLPSRDGMPLARRSVVQAADPARSVVGNAASVILANWQLTGLAVSPLAALVFLSHLRHQPHGRATAAETGLYRLRLGNDLLYWSNAAKFALEILIGQHYVPALRMNGGSSLYALWQPMLLDDRVKHRFAAMTATMPPVCRAYNVETIDDALAPLALSEHFVATVVDAAVRVWSNGHAAVSVSSAPLQWANQLRSPQRVLSLPPQPAHRLAQDWQAWIEQLHVTSDANFRITFELVEPDQSAQSAGYTSALGQNSAEVQTAHADLDIAFLSASPRRPAPVDFG